MKLGEFLCFFFGEHEIECWENQYQRGYRCKRCKIIVHTHLKNYKRRK